LTDAETTRTDALPRLSAVCQAAEHHSQRSLMTSSQMTDGRVTGTDSCATDTNDEDEVISTDSILGMLTVVL